MDGGEGPAGGGGGWEAAMARRCVQWWEKGCGKRSGQAPYSVRADDHELDEGWWCVEDVAAECKGQMGRVRADVLLGQVASNTATRRQHWD